MGLNKDCNHLLPCRRKERQVFRANTALPTVGFLPFWACHKIYRAEDNNVFSKESQNLLQNIPNLLVCRVGLGQLPDTDLTALTSPPT